MYVANVGEDGLTEQPYLESGATRCARAEGTRRWSSICAAIEAEIADMSDEDKADVPGRHRAWPSRAWTASIRAALQAAGPAVTYFTAGEKEVRAWTIRGAPPRPQAAGVIHTDFEKGFIRAEVDRVRRLRRVQGRAGREGGRARCALEGKEYVVQDGDVMHFLFNV